MNCFVSASVTGGRDVPGGPVVENPPCKSEDKGLIPGQGTKIPHATQQVLSYMLWSPLATSREAVHHIKRSHM